MSDYPTVTFDAEGRTAEEWGEWWWNVLRDNLDQDWTGTHSLVRHDLEGAVWWCREIGPHEEIVLWVDPADWCGHPGCGWVKLVEVTDE